MSARKRHGGQLLAAYRERLGLSHRSAAEQIGCSHPSLMAWESGRVTPVQPYRDRIEAWSGGELPAAIWRSATERSAELRIAVAKKRFGASAQIRRAG